MAFDLCRYCVMSKNGSKRRIIGGDSQAENVFPKDKDVKVNPSNKTPAGFHAHLSRWADILSLGA